MTVDYNGEQTTAEPASSVMSHFLRRSFSVADVLKRALRGWLFGLVGMSVGLAFGLYTIWVTPPTYTVSIGLLPTDSGGGDPLAGGEGGGALGAIAGLIGIGGGPVPKFTRFVASLYASGVARIMDDKYDMVCRTFSEDCDPATHTWRKHTGFNAWFLGMKAHLSHTADPDSPRTALDLVAYNVANIQMTSDKTTHVLTLTMDSRDPKFATEYLNALVQSTNDFIKGEDRKRIEPYVTYLNGKLGSATLNIGQRDALSSLLLEQERKLMLSTVNVPYAASIQDGPNVTSSNSAIRLLVVDTVLGLVLGMAGGAFWKARNARRRARSAAWQH